MMCAARIGQRGRRLLLIEHARKLAEKIRISGGRRFNFTNQHCRLPARWQMPDVRRMIDLDQRAELQESINSVEAGKSLRAALFLTVCIFCLGLV